ncbi:MAG: hypothetical protein HY548_09100, partial [Elusimicrobia bacterium]|nr:hypothetical protein [Elusimicrobiota bacterium]
GYMYQRWAVQDAYLYDGFSRTLATATGTYYGLLPMDTLYKSYNVHAVYVQANYKF